MVVTHRESKYTLHIGLVDITETGQLGEGNFSIQGHLASNVEIVDGLETRGVILVTGNDNISDSSVSRYVD